MVSTESDNLDLVSSHSGPVPELLKRSGHLLQSNGIVDGCDGDVTAVEDGGPVGVGVYAGSGVEAPEGGLAGRGGADGAGPEAGAGSVGDGCVEGSAEDGDVEEGRRRGQAFCVGEVGEGGDACEGPLDES
jgi:hypothetical protein